MHTSHLDQAKQRFAEAKSLGRANLFATRDALRKIDPQICATLERPLIISYQALVLHSLASSVASFMADITDPSDPRVEEMELTPLMMAVQNSIYSLDSVLQCLGVDMGITEEDMTC